MKPTNQPPDLNDDDIRALLDARPPANSPADLDARILTAAKAEVQRDIVQPRSAARYGSWLAVAAVCVLAVILVPVLQNTSESSREAFSPQDSLNDTAVPTAGVVAPEVMELAQESDSEKLTAPAITPQVAQEVLSEEIAKSRIERAAKKETEQLKVAPDISANASARRRDSAETDEPTLDLSDIEAMTDEDIRRTFESHPYRRERASWQAEIKRLAHNKQAVQVVREQRLFERMYPGAQ